MECETLYCYRRVAWRVAGTRVFRPHNVCDKCKDWLEKWAKDVHPSNRPTFTTLKEKTCSQTA